MVFSPFWMDGPGYVSPSTQAQLVTMLGYATTFVCDFSSNNFGLVSSQD